MRLKIIAAWLLTAGLLCFLICMHLFMDGMFMDGQQYAIVAKNMAAGLGDFWYPVLSPTWWRAGSPFFMEHPPLGYAMQALFFKLFGNGMFTERWYGFCIIVFSVLIIVQFWKELFRDVPQKRRVAFLPVILWLSVPVVFWAYRNNLLENSMAILDMLAVFCIYRALSRSHQVFLLISIAGVLILGAVLVKGMPGLFPWVTIPVFYILWPHKYKWYAMLGWFIYLLVVPAIGLGAIWLWWPGAADSISFYVTERLFVRIHDAPLVASRLFSIKSLAMQLMVPGIPVLLLYTYRKWRRFSISVDTKSFWFFIFIGLSASLPLILTSVQREFYLIPAYPWFALAFALLIHEPVAALFHQNWPQRLKYIFVLCIAIFFSIALGLSIFKAGTPGRDHAVLHDTYLFGEMIPRHTSLHVSERVYNEDWAFQFYLLRYFDIAICVDEKSSPYYLTRCALPENNTHQYQLIAKGERFFLYKTSINQ